MKQELIRVLIADDHQMVRETWKLLLQQHTNISVVAECDNGATAIELARTEKPDIILMDINMQPVNGFEATRKIIEENPLQKVIGISVNNQTTYARNMLRMGAKGFVTKNCSPQEMVVAIVEVSIGKTYICEEIRNRMKAETE